MSPITTDAPVKIPREKGTRSRENACVQYPAAAAHAKQQMILQATTPTAWLAWVNPAAGNRVRSVRKEVL
jgi:hypothetical protein